MGSPMLWNSGDPSTPRWPRGSSSIPNRCVPPVQRPAPFPPVAAPARSPEATSPGKMATPMGRRPLPTMIRPVRSFSRSAQAATQPHPSRRSEVGNCFRPLFSGAIFAMGHENAGTLSLRPAFPSPRHRTAFGALRMCHAAGSASLARQTDRVDVAPGRPPERQDRHQWSIGSRQVHRASRGSALPPRCSETGLVSTFDGKCTLMRASPPSPWTMGTS